MHCDRWLCVDLLLRYIQVTISFKTCVHTSFAAHDQHLHETAGIGQYEEKWTSKWFPRAGLRGLKALACYTCRFLRAAAKNGVLSYDRYRGYLEDVSSLLDLGGVCMTSNTFQPYGTVVELGT